jgi:hypothetical protein
VGARLLPLKCGICVETTTPFRTRSNASIVSYRGGQRRGGVHDQGRPVPGRRLPHQAGVRLPRRVHVSILKGTILFNPAKGNYDPADLYQVMRPDDGRAPYRPGARAC